MRRAAATGLLVDLDGVLRRWDAAVLAGVERRHGLAPGALVSTAMSWPLLRPAISGEITHDEWMTAVTRSLSATAGARTGVGGGADGTHAAHAAPVDAGAAVREWQEYRGEVDAEVLAFVREVRAGGRPVGLATNATDLLDADLDLLGLAGEVDHVINSSVVGSPKPSKEFFAAACRALGLPPEKVLLVDDDDRAIRGARVAGLAAYRWSDSADLRYVRAALGLRP